MYERMLDKQNVPSTEEFTKHIGVSAKLFFSLDDFLLNELKLERQLRFPYGNSYGWGMKYFAKSKHFCDVFAEKDSFTVMIRLTDKQFQQAYDGLTDYAKRLIDDKYPCGSGGWIHFRVLTQEHLEDIEKLLRQK